MCITIFCIKFPTVAQFYMNKSTLVNIYSSTVVELCVIILLLEFIHYLRVIFFIIGFINC